MEPHRLTYCYTDEETKWQKHEDGLQHTQEMISTIKLSNKNIMDNNKIISELEKEAIELSSHNAKNTRHANQLQKELDEMSTNKLEIQRCLEDKNYQLNLKFDKSKSKSDSMFEIIKNKEKQIEIQKKKIEVLETNFSKAELFLLKLMSVYDKLDSLCNGANGGMLDPFRTSYDGNTIEVLKAQHKKSLIGVKEFYAKFDKKRQKADADLKELYDSLTEHKNAFGIK